MRNAMGLKLNFARDELLTIVRENREKHAATYAKALVVFKEKLTEKMQKRLEQIAETKEFDHRILTIPLTVPEQHVDEYDRAIRMLAMTSQDQIELTQGEFAQLVLDEWDWSNSFASNTVGYTNS